MVFHQLQLFVCAWLAGRYRPRRRGAGRPPPRSAFAAAGAEPATLARAAAIGLPVPGRHAARA